MAQVVVKGKNIEISQPLYDYVEKKIGKLDRHLDKITAVTAELSKESHKSSSDRQIAQVTMVVNGQIMRAEETSSDMFAAVDAVVDKLQRSVERYKSKRYRKDDIRKSRRQAAKVSDAADAAATAIALESEVAGETGITHTKRFQIKPMSPDEATEQMELLGHDFYIFYNQDADGVSVVYRRKNGSYGLLLPERA